MLFRSIDEIYNTVFRPWLQHNRPNMRMFYFWPFGHTDIDSICNYGNNNRFIEKPHLEILENKNIIDTGRRNRFNSAKTIGWYKKNFWHKKNYN